MTQPRQTRRTRQQPAAVPRPSTDHDHDHDGDEDEDDLDGYVKDVVDALPRSPASSATCSR